MGRSGIGVRIARQYTVHSFFTVLTKKKIGIIPLDMRQNDWLTIGSRRGIRGLAPRQSAGSVSEARP
jgi:hypothetical protein